MLVSHHPFKLTLTFLTNETSLKSILNVELIKVVIAFLPSKDISVICQCIQKIFENLNLKNSTESLKAGAYLARVHRQFLDILSLSARVSTRNGKNLLTLSTHNIKILSTPLSLNRHG